VISPLDAGIVFVAGVVAGLVGTGGAIASLVSYPVLLAVGLPALTANVTNIVGLVACWPGSALTSGPELRGRGPWLRRFMPLTAAGGLAGALALQSTPPGVFASIVPLLIAGGSLSLLAQPRIASRRMRRTERRGRQGRFAEPLLAAGLLAIAAYSGYFGAGSGVMALTVILILVDRRLVYANALKNVLTYAAVIPAAILFAATGRVHWAAAWPLALGVLIGARLGPSLARTLPSAILRAAIAACGLALTVVLAIQAF